ncbi:hypothetical protein I79_013866 [Cricetulus griseus]|uniref:Uncharacterized protein n=1 Tax=Cricetulus griseus TaxID=10029 RepID=G3HSN2_CRIGR|nr:hypothetical protein I79_013866 [Cricetulus griseus]
MSLLCLQSGASLIYPQLSLRVGTRIGGTGLVQSCKGLSLDLCFEWISRKLLQVSSGLRTENAVVLHLEKKLWCPLQRGKMCVLLALSCWVSATCTY